MMPIMPGWFRPAAVRLAAGESLIWRGGPGWRALAVRVFHVRLVAGYFVLLMLADMLQTRLQHGTGLDALRAAIPSVLTGAGALLILLALSAAMARSTCYTLTTRRVVLQFGVALPATLSVPLHRIAEASLRMHNDHSGDIALRLPPGERIGLLKLWPHVRPWRIAAPQPMLRDLPHVATLAGPLWRALAEAKAAQRAVAAPKFKLAS